MTKSATSHAQLAELRTATYQQVYLEHGGVYVCACVCGGGPYS